MVNWLSKSDKFQKLDQLTEEHGAIIVALTRLVPIFPFNLLNYGFGLTKVPFWTYVFWTWLCTLPGTILYVVGADAVTKALMQGRIPWVLVGAFVVALVLLTLLVRSAKRKLQLKEMKTAARRLGGTEEPAAMPEVSPLDQYNEALVANVRPPDWMNPEPAPRYNLVVIGGGTAGLVSAAGAAGLGAKVALVERHLLGGDCLNVGCVPSKAIIRSSRVYADIRDAGLFRPEGLERAPKWIFRRSWNACGACGRASVTTTRPSASGTWGWMFSWVRPGLPARIPWRWEARPCALKRRSLPPAAGPCAPRCRDWRRPAISPMRRSFPLPSGPRVSWSWAAGPSAASLPRPSNGWAAR